MSEWNAGKLAVYDPTTGRWREWLLPGARPHAVRRLRRRADPVWLSDFGANAIVRFDPETERFTRSRFRRVRERRQLLGRPGELWGAESGVNKLVVVRTR